MFQLLPSWGASSVRITSYLRIGCNFRRADRPCPPSTAGFDEPWMSLHQHPLLIHVTTTDISLELLLGPQLSAFVDAGYDVVAMSAGGPFVPAIEARGV